MSDLVGNPEDRFSHNGAHIETCDNQNQMCFRNIPFKEQKAMMNLSSTNHIPDMLKDV